MGAILAKCLPNETRTVITDAIPNRDVLIAMAERVADFERQLAVKKAVKAEEAAYKRARKTIGRLQKASAKRVML